MMPSGLFQAQLRGVGALDRSARRMATSLAPASLPGIHLFASMQLPRASSISIRLLLIWRARPLQLTPVPSLTSFPLSAPEHRVLVVVVSLMLLLLLLLFYVAHLL